jgi:hypothetical protein
MSPASDEDCVGCALALIQLIREHGLAGLIKRFTITGAVVGMSAVEALDSWFRVHHTLGHPDDQQVIAMAEEWEQSDDPQKRRIVREAVKYAKQFDANEER